MSVTRSVIQHGYNCQGKESNIQKRILESDITLQIGKHESELATRLNWAANDGDLHRLRQLVEAGADPSKTDYDGRSPLVLYFILMYVILIACKKDGLLL